MLVLPSFLLLTVMTVRQLDQSARFPLPVYWHHVTSFLFSQVFKECALAVNYLENCSRSRALLLRWLPYPHTSLAIHSARSMQKLREDKLHMRLGARKLPTIRTKLF